jgi:hypothetical protein
MAGPSDAISSPFNDIAGAAPGAWDWLKRAGNWVKDVADENPGATKLVLFGVGALLGISWGGQLADAFFRFFPALDNGFMRFLIHGLAVVGAICGANALTQWATNRPGAVEHREQVAKEEADRTREVLAQRDRVVRENGGDPYAHQVDRSLSNGAFLKANRDHVMGNRVQIPDASLRPSGDHPQVQPQTYSSGSPYGQVVTTTGSGQGPNWGNVPRYP